MIGVAAGLASQGKVAFASSFAMFATGKAFEQIRQSVCVPELDVKICATHAGLTVGEDGKSHQMLEDVTIMRVLPHMSVIVPADAVEARQAVLAAAEIAGPVYVRLSRASTPVVFADSYRFEFGKAALLREGRDLAIVAMGVTVAAASAPRTPRRRRRAGARHQHVDHLAPRRGFDRRCGRDCGAILTAEEHQQSGGLGDAVAQAVVKHHPVPMDMLGMDGAFGQSGTGDELLAHYGLDAAGIAARQGPLRTQVRREHRSLKPWHLTTQRRDEIAEAARQVRIDTVRMVHAATCGHPGGPLGMADFMATLFMEHLRLDASNRHAPDRDRFVLGNGHTCAGYYSLLAQKGLIERTCCSPSASSALPAGPPAPQPRPRDRLLDGQPGQQPLGVGGHGARGEDERLGRARLLGVERRREPGGPDLGGRHGGRASTAPPTSRCWWTSTTCRSTGTCAT